MRTTTHEAIILRHLHDYRGITSWEAFTEYGITRLSAVIFNLKEKGYHFRDEWVHKENRYNEPVKFKNYLLMGTFDMFGGYSSGEGKAQ